MIAPHTTPEEEYVKSSALERRSLLNQFILFDRSRLVFKNFFGKPRTQFLALYDAAKADSVRFTQFVDNSPEDTFTIGLGFCATANVGKFNGNKTEFLQELENRIRKTEMSSEVEEKLIADIWLMYDRAQVDLVRLADTLENYFGQLKYAEYVLCSIFFSNFSLV